MGISLLSMKRSLAAGFGIAAMFVQPFAPVFPCAHAAELGANGPKGESGHRKWGPEMVVPLSLERIAALPEPERDAWTQYWERSQASKEHDKKSLDAEVKAQGIENSIPTLEYLGTQVTFDSRKPLSWYASEEARKLAETMISYQAPNGGWCKAINYGKGPRQPAATWFPVTHPTKRNWWIYSATFDNGATTKQMRFLARAFRATGREEYRRSFITGLDYIFAAQYPSGGWPQVYPLKHSYNDGITFNDDVVVSVMELLRDVAGDNPEFSFVDAERRQRAGKAVQDGLRMILKAQVVRAGKPTVWGAQHDPLTIEVTGARRIEPPALSGAESAAILRYLMQIKNPPPEVVRSIEGALSWFESSKITGIRQTTREGYVYYESDPASQTQWWARFYDPSTNKPVFSGHEDGIVYGSFQEMWNNGNRNSYDYYTQRPSSILARELPKWRKMIASTSKQVSTKNQ